MPVSERALPSDLSIERTILGASILSQEVAAEVVSRTTVTDYSLEAHKRIFTAILELYEAGIQIDRMLVIQKLQLKGQLDSLPGGLGISYILSLDELLPEMPNVAEYIAILKEKTALRAIIFATENAGMLAFRPDADSREILSGLNSRINGFLSESEADRPTLISEFVDNFPGGVSRLLDPSQGDPGLPTGLRDLDELTDGFHEAEIVIVGARPSQGKTSLLTTVAENVANTGKHVVIFSLEMPKRRLMERMICGRAGVGLKRFRQGDLDTEARAKIQRSMSQIYELPLSIDDTGALAVEDLALRLQATHQKKPVALVCIDYIQLLTLASRHSHAGREERLSEICQRLQKLTKSTGIPMFIAAQLNRETEKRFTRGKKQRPQLSDLRESGALEQIANVVVMIYREFLAEPDNEDADRAKAELVVVKNRDGEIGTVETRFSGWTFRFENASAN